MTKQEFTDALRARLAGLPEADVAERLDFYGEMIDDRMEDGLSEEEAVADVGTVEEIAEQIIASIPFAKIAKERLKPKRQLETWEILLIILGAPIWLSVAASLFAVVVSVYAVVFSVIVSLWAVFVSLVACSVGGVAAGAIVAVGGNVAVGAATVGAGLICAGLAIFLFFGCEAATRGVILLTKKMATAIKKCFVKGEVA